MSSAKEQVASMANILIARNLATSLLGSSKTLSPKSDRVRFHEIRASARAILIGGESYRNEPYQKIKLPLYISSRQLPETANGNKYIYNQSPSWLLARALKDQGEPVLIEGGVNFLSGLIADREIDLIYITRVDKDGDGHFFDQGPLIANYKRVSNSDKSGVSFENWRLK